LSKRSQNRIYARVGVAEQNVIARALYPSLLTVYFSVSSDYIIT
jgi:hypothetical protein